MKSFVQKLTVVLGMAVLTAASLTATATASTGDATSAARVQPGATVTVSRTVAEGVTLTKTVHAMTTAEIADKGLTKYVAADSAAPAELSAGAQAPAPQQRGTLSTGTVQPMSSGCWGMDISTASTFGLQGNGHEDWCGDGTWITYTNATCWGSDGWYPTYAYLGCSLDHGYGVGWNIATVGWHWDLCSAWFSGACAKHKHVNDSDWYQGNGNWG